MFYRRNKKSTPSQNIHGVAKNQFKAELGQLKRRSTDNVQIWMAVRVPFVAQYISPDVFHQFLITVNDIGGGVNRTRRLFNVVADMLIEAELSQNLDILQAAIESPIDIEIPSGEPKSPKKSSPSKKKSGQKPKKTEEQKRAKQVNELQQFLDSQTIVDTSEIVIILNGLPRHYFIHEGVLSSIVNLTPHTMYFMEKDERGIDQVITLNRSGMYLRAIPPKQWSEEGAVKYDRHYVGQSIRFLKQSMRQERNVVYAYLAPVDVPKSRTDYYAYGIFPTPDELAHYGAPNTFYIVSALTECIDPIYPTFIMPFKDKKIDGVKVVTAFQLADGICHGLI